MPVSRITKEDLKQRLDADDPALAPVLLDVRLKYPYEHSGLRLPGAIRMSPDAVDASQLPRDRPIVVYDSDPDDVVSTSVAAELVRRGFQASALKGGLPEWIGANYPVESKEASAQS